MNKSDTIINLIYLPRRFNNLGNISIYSLLKETGYFNIHDQISESAIREVLHNHAECVNEWIRFSEDKRSSVGWYFQQEGKDYEIGYFSHLESNIPPIKYFDRVEACAAFIKKEIEDIMKTGSKTAANSEA